MVDRIEQQTLPQSPRGFNRFASPQAFGANNAGQAFEQFGYDVSDTLMARAQADAEVEAHKQVVDDIVYLENQRNETLQQSEPGAPKFTERMKFLYEDLTKKRAEDLSELQKRSYMNRMNAYMPQFIRASAETERQEATRHTKQTIMDTAEREAMLFDGFDYGRILQEAPMAIAATKEVIANSPLSPAEKQEMLDMVPAMTRESAVRAAARKDPYSLAKDVGKQYTPDVDGITEFILDREGGFVETDGASGAPALFGINRRSFPEKFDEVKAVFDSGDEAKAKKMAADFYKEEVIKKNGINEMPQDVALVVADGVVNHRYAIQKKLVSMAKEGATAEELLDVRQEEYDRLRETSPEKYEQSYAGWMARLQHVEAAIGTDTAITGNPLLDMAETPEEQERFRQIIESERAALDKQQKELVNQYTATNYANYSVAVDNLQVTQGELDQARKTGQITPSNWATLSKSLRKRQDSQKDEILGAERFNLAMNGQLRLDPKSKTDKKAVDTAFQSMVTNLPEGTDVNQAIGKFLEATKILPETLRQDVRGKLRSGSPEERIQAAGMIKNIQQIEPRMAEDLEQNDIRVANHLHSLVNSGMTPAQAIERAAEVAKIRTDPQLEQIYEDRFKQVLKEKPVANMLADKLNSMWTIDPDIPEAMVGDYQMLLHEEYIRTGGDLEAAQATADTFIQTNWGKTNIGVSTDKSRSTRWMKRPPEKFYAAPVLDMDAEQQSAWMEEQLLEEINGDNRLSAEPIGADRVRLVESRMKHPDGLPRYNAYITFADGTTGFWADENGPYLWKPDWEVSKERKRWLERNRRMPKETTVYIGGAPNIVSQEGF